MARSIPCSSHLTQKKKGENGNGAATKAPEKEKRMVQKDDDSESWSSEENAEPEEEVEVPQKTQKKKKEQVVVEEEDSERAEEEKTDSLPQEWMGWKATIRKTVKYSPGQTLPKKKLLKKLKRVYQRHLEKSGGEYNFDAFKAKVNQKVFFF